MHIVDLVFSFRMCNDEIRWYRLNFFKNAMIPHPLGGGVIAALPE
jgi:hypothetical protein